MPINTHKQREAYRKWWVGQYCRIRGHVQFKKVVDVITYGPPSYVYGTAELVFEDGSGMNISHRGKRPMKKDVEVLPPATYCIKYGGHVVFIRPEHGCASLFLYMDPECTKRIDKNGGLSVLDLMGEHTWPYMKNPEKVEFKPQYQWE